MKEAKTSNYREEGAMCAVRLHAVQTPSKVLLPSFARRAAPVFFVILHGFLAHSGAMNSFVVMLRNALDAHNRAILETNDATSTVLPFHITSLDARNHGLSPHTATHVLESLVDDLDLYLAQDLPTTVKEVSAQLGVDTETTGDQDESSGPQRTRVVAIGHSMGSMTWTQHLMNHYAAACSSSPSHRPPHGATAAVPSSSKLAVQGLVSMDMPPIIHSRMAPGLVEELVEIIDCMKTVDLTRISDLRSAHDEFYRCGMHDIRVRGLCTTNLALTIDPVNPTRRVASWKCNVPVLEHSIRSGALFFPDAFLKGPSTQEGRTAATEALTQPSVGRVPVLSILGGASPIGGASAFHDVWSRYAVSLEQHTIPEASHTVYYDKPRETIEVVKNFLAHIRIL